MTNQEKKEQLNRYRRLNDHIDALLLEKERWMTIATKVTPSYTGMPGGGSSDKQECISDRLSKIDTEITDQVNELVRARAEIVAVIDSVQDDTLRLLLRLRYIDGLTWERIAERMRYCEMQIWRLHGDALSAIKM